MKVFIHRRWLPIRRFRARVRYGKRWRQLRIFRGKYGIRFKKRFRLVKCYRGLVRVRVNKRWKTLKRRRRRRSKKRTMQPSNNRKLFCNESTQNNNRPLYRMGNCAKTRRCYPAPWSLELYHQKEPCKLLKYCMPNASTVCQKHLDLFLWWSLGLHLRFASLPWCPYFYLLITERLLVGVFYQVTKM